MTGFSQEVRQGITQAAEILRASQTAVAFTGAGLSTPSGVPDFRSEGSGLWTRFLPMEVASLSTFRYHPERFFEWLHPLASHMLTAEPNPAHIALARLEQAGFLKAIITQNIDVLHQRGGAQNVLEVHGTLNTLSCVGCFRQQPADRFLPNYLQNHTIPRCPECNAILKPDVILFEEQLPVRVWQKAEEACRAADAILVSGTSLEVMPSAGLPMRVLENGGRLVIVNRTPTYIDPRADVIIAEEIAVVIPAIVEEVFGGP